MAKFGDDPAFVASHVAPSPKLFVAKSGKSVTFKADGGPDGGGFFVRPTGKSHAAVILVHEFWGLNDYIRREAERLNTATGYAGTGVFLLTEPVIDVA